MFAHGVDTPLTFDIQEGGVDLQLGVRFDEVGALGDMQPYVIGSVNLSGDTSFIGAGVSWKFDLGGVYVRPGLGVVVHDGPSRRENRDINFRTDLGSRVLFEPEISIGTHLTEKVSIEASWVHISHARLFSKTQNPGIDMIGARLNVAF